MNGQHGYNDSKVIPKRSAAQSIKCNSLKGNSRLDGSRAAYFFLIVIVIDLISLNQAIRKANNFFIGHTSFRMVCWGPARRRVSSAPSPGAELPLWSKLIQACPIPLERLQLIPACPIPLGHLQLIRLKAVLMRKNTVHALTYADGTGIILIGQDLNGQPIFKSYFQLWK